MRAEQALEAKDARGIEKCDVPVILRERGSTIVEFMLALVLFFVLIAGLLDASLYFSKYAILDQAVKNAARAIAVRNFNNEDEKCGDVAQEAIDTAKTDFETAYGIKGINVRAEIVKAPYAAAGLKQPILYLTAEWKFSCITCLALGLRKVTVAATHRQLFQDRCIDLDNTWDCERQ